MSLLDAIMSLRPGTPTSNILDDTSLKNYLNDPAAAIKALIGPALPGYLLAPSLKIPAGLVANGGDTPSSDAEPSDDEEESGDDDGAASDDNANVVPAGDGASAEVGARAAPVTQASQVVRARPEVAPESDDEFDSGAVGAISHSRIGGLSQLDLLGDDSSSQMPQISAIDISRLLLDNILGSHEPALGPAVSPALRSLLEQILSGSHSVRR